MKDFFQGQLVYRGELIKKWQQINKLQSYFFRNIFVSQALCYNSFVIALLFLSQSLLQKKYSFFCSFSSKSIHSFSNLIPHEKIRKKIKKVLILIKLINFRTTRINLGMLQKAHHIHYIFLFKERQVQTLRSIDISIDNPLRKMSSFGHFMQLFIFELQSKSLATLIMLPEYGSHFEFQQLWLMVDKVPFTTRQSFLQKLHKLNCALVVQLFLYFFNDQQFQQKQNLVSFATRLVITFEKLHQSTGHTQLHCFSNCKLDWFLQKEEELVKDKLIYVIENEQQKSGLKQAFKENQTPLYYLSMSLSIETSPQYYSHLLIKPTIQLILMQVLLHKLYALLQSRLIILQILHNLLFGEGLEWIERGDEIGEGECFFTH